MAIEDVQGYKPHTDQKIETVNQIKAAENALGCILDNVDKQICAEIFSLIEAKSADGRLELDTRRIQIRLAKDRLKEASMWACRAVFQPDEKY